MKLYCVRHGEAESLLTNPERPLTAKGQADIQDVAAELKARNIKVNHIIHSGKRRTEQTAALLAASFPSAKVNAAPTLLAENADVAPLLAMLETWCEPTMLVGHLPFIQNLLHALLGSTAHASYPINCPPGTVICLEQSSHAGQWIVEWSKSYKP